MIGQRSTTGPPVPRPGPVASHSTRPRSRSPTGRKVSAHKPISVRGGITPGLGVYLITRYGGVVAESGNSVLSLPPQDRRVTKNELRVQVNEI
jgi:hypothetical protein